MSKILVNAQKCNHGENVPLSLAIFSSTVRLWGGYFSSVDLEMGVRVRLREARKCRALVEKSPGPKFGVRLREVSVSGGSTVSLKVIFVSVNDSL